MVGRVSKLLVVLQTVRFWVTLCNHPQGKKTEPRTYPTGELFCIMAKEDFGQLSRDPKKIRACG